MGRWHATYYRRRMISTLRQSTVVLVVACLLAVPVSVTGTTSAAAVTTVNPNRGVDISWPECPPTVGIPLRKGQGKPMPSPSPGFVVLGLTNGPGFTPNPCISDELAFVRAHRIPIAAYAMTTYPTAAQLARYGVRGPWPTRTTLGRLSNVGAAQARYNIAGMSSLGIRTPIVWIDVESYAPWDWTASHAKNAAVVKGAVWAYQKAGYRVGFYSSTSMWSRILGSAGPRGYPEWRTVGASTSRAALARCSTASFAGGRAVLSQWWTTSKDYDLVCPAYATAVSRARYFSVT
jgi:hypothetical protein